LFIFPRDHLHPVTMLTPPKTDRRHHCWNPATATARSRPSSLPETSRCCCPRIRSSPLETDRALARNQLPPPLLEPADADAGTRPSGPHTGCRCQGLAAEMAQPPKWHDRPHRPPPDQGDAKTWVPLQRFEGSRRRSDDDESTAAAR
jgi:hypothetical protein